MGVVDRGNCVSIGETGGGKLPFIGEKLLVMGV
jgi:hypothetical protein